MTVKKYGTVAAFLEDLSDERRGQVEALRAIIHAAEPSLTEHIKWNAPSYVFNGEDRITFNTHYPDRILVLLHMGATRTEDKKGVPIMDDLTGLISWNSDIRGTLSFESQADVTQKREAVTTLIKRWLAL